MLHTVGYKDGGKVRPILYRASLSEMIVPYGDPTDGHFRKNAFDVGEYGIGLQIVFYYSLAGIACFWFYRKTLGSGAKTMFMQDLWPLLSALFLIVVGYYNIKALDMQTNLLSIDTIAVGIFPLLYYKIVQKSAFYREPRESAVMGE